VNTGRITVTCPRGLPPFLAQELRALGFTPRAAGAAAVETDGSLEDTQRLNLFLRTGHRVLFRLDEFRAERPDTLYRRAAALPWEDWIAPDGYVCVTAAVETPAIRDSRYPALLCKDAIVDRIRQKRGRRPDSGPNTDRACVFVHWRDDRCAIHLDTTGEPLARRGYRHHPFKAPMQETLAAAVLMAAGWPPAAGAPLANPMCGSGTLAIEAALAGLGRPAGDQRANFAFMHLKPFRRDRWIALKRGAARESLSRLEYPIVASDRDPAAVSAARRNAAAAQVDHVIEFEVCDFRESPLPAAPGIVILNPEYGERLGDETQLAPVYEGIGDFLKRRCAGWRGFVFTGSPALARRIGLRTAKRTVFFNGPIECRLLEFDLYAGSRKPGGHSAE